MFPAPILGGSQLPVMPAPGDSTPFLVSMGKQQVWLFVSWFFYYTGGWTAFPNSVSVCVYLSIKLPIPILRLCFSCVGFFSW